MQIPININFLIGAIFICLFGFARFKKYQSKSRLKNYQNRQSKRIQENKIIIAIEPNNIFATISTTRRQRFIQLQIEKYGLSKLLSFVKKLFGFGMIYYKAKDSKRNNIAFLQSLLHTQRVQLVLYTTLDEQIVDSLLKRLDLAKYFNPQQRRFCNGQLKHPTEIDSNTKRVIILTDSKSDHNEEDSKYFIVVRRQELKEYGRMITELIGQNENIDELHNEFVHWKIDMESDFQSSHQKTS